MINDNNKTHCLCRSTYNAFFAYTMYFLIIGMCLSTAESAVETINTVIANKGTVMNAFGGYTASEII